MAGKILGTTVYYDADCNLGKLEGKKITVLGYGSQGHAHALNLKENGMDVTIGLRGGSSSWKAAEEAGLTVKETAYAQSLTNRPVKGMLTGPVTILNWSFERTDISKEEIFNQIAIALKNEIELLEKAEIFIQSRSKLILNQLKNKMVGKKKVELFLIFVIKGFISFFLKKNNNFLKKRLFYFKKGCII